MNTHVFRNWIGLQLPSSGSSGGSLSGFSQIMLNSHRRRHLRDEVHGSTTYDIRHEAQNFPKHEEINFHLENCEMKHELAYCRTTPRQSIAPHPSLIPGSALDAHSPGRGTSAENNPHDNSKHDDSLFGPKEYPSICDKQHPLLIGQSRALGDHCRDLGGVGREYQIIILSHHRFCTSYNTWTF